VDNAALLRSSRGVDIPTAAEEPRRRTDGMVMTSARTVEMGGTGKSGYSARSGANNGTNVDLQRMGHGMILFENRK
jgi:hypothetical protein